MQVQNENDARGQLLRRFRAAKGVFAAGAPAITTAQHENLSRAWSEFKSQNSGAASAIKDARLALLVMLIEGSNFAKLTADCQMKGDAKSWWSLAASGMSITSALFDIASVPAKSMFGAESWSYQRIKGIGGILSSAATGILAVIDAKDAEKSFGKGQTTVAALYSVKAILGSLNFTLSAATTFTYAAPMITRVTGNAVIGTAAKVVSARAAAIIGLRILFMSAGAWLTVAVFGVQIFIWAFSDDELQSWCALCVFGIRHSARDAYRSSVEQNDALEKALIEVGLKHD